MTRNPFSSESESCRSDALITCPPWHNQLARSALRDHKLTTNAKGLLYVLDYVGDGPVSTAGHAELADKLGITQRQLRTASTSLTSAGYLRREQVGGYSWRWRSLKRSPYAWSPGWTMRWFDLRPELTVRHLVLYLAIIDYTPQDVLRVTTGPWCEKPIAALARTTGVRTNTVPQLLDQLSAAGLVLKIGGAGRVPILLPCVEPEDRAGRAERVECLLRIMQDRDATIDYCDVQGADAAVPVDNMDLARHILFKSDGDRRADASWSATGRGRRGLITTGGTQ